jgi:trehalose 6-phosphate synthase
MGRLVVVSNRIPVANARVGSTGGLAVALSEVLARRESLWIGWNGVITDDPGAPTHRRVKRTEIVGFGLTPQMHAGFYAGFANGSLWPLFHYRLGLVDFKRSDYQAYLATNAGIAELIRRNLRPDDTLWVHDFHLIPLARELRRLGVTQPIGFFLHIPFPAAELFSSLPVHRDLAEAMSHFDLVGFQTHTCRKQFAEYAGSADPSVAEIGGRRFELGVFPIGIDTQRFAAFASDGDGGPEARRLTDSVGARALVIGVDRLDYSKGLPNRIEGYGEFLARNPEWHGRVQYLQIAPISRGEVANYRAMRRELDGLAGRLNGKYAEFDWTPLRYLNRGYPRKSLAGFYRQARVGLVTPLRDGMNLVAKEFVAAQRAEDPGVLILSEFAGAAAELGGALKINPYDVDAIADALSKALSMPLDERVSRWKADFGCVSTNTATAWAESFLATLAGTQRPQVASAA